MNIVVFILQIDCSNIIIATGPLTCNATKIVAYNRFDDHNLEILFS